MLMLDLFPYRRPRDVKRVFRQTKCGQCIAKLNQESEGPSEEREEDEKTILEFTRTYQNSPTVIILVGKNNKQ